MADKKFEKVIIWPDGYPTIFKYWIVCFLICAEYFSIAHEVGGLEVLSKSYISIIGLLSSICTFLGGIALIIGFFSREVYYREIK